MADPFAPITPKRPHAPRFRAEAPTQAERQARAGLETVAQWHCSVCNRAYQYAAPGRYRGQCAVRAAPGQSFQPHEYVACPAHAELPICVTHSPAFAGADRQFRKERAR